MNKRREISIHLRLGLNGDRLVACHLNGNLKIIYRRVRGWRKVFILNHSACQAVKMEMCPARDSSLEDAAPGGGEVFRFICLFEKVRNAPSTILKTLNLSVTWKTEGDGRRTRSTDDSSDGVPLLRAEIFHVVSHYAKLTLSYFSNVTCLQDVSELPGN